MITLGRRCGAVRCRKVLRGAVRRRARYERTFILRVAGVRLNGSGSFQDDCYHREEAGPLCGSAGGKGDLPAMKARTYTIRYEMLF